MGPLEITETLVGSAAKPPLRRETLTVVAGLDLERVFTLSERSTSIGRGEACTLRLRDRGVSRHHASIDVVGHSLVLRDNHAKNGTYANGQRIDEHRLRPGDEIQLGPNVNLLFTYASGASERIAQQRTAREQLLYEQMYAERIESLAEIVAGLAHEINTPLGVAATANGVISSLADEMERTEPKPELSPLLAELKQASELMGRNLARASGLVKSFKQLSARQLSDEYVDCDLGSVVQDCFAAMSADLKRSQIDVTTNWTAGVDFPWAGFPGHLSQVMINLVQNTLLHAYKEQDRGRIDVHLTEEGNFYRVEYQDYGSGVPAEILPKMFEPFVTSGREMGAAGLGLAIAHNIVTNILHGEIRCSSEAGHGAKFVMMIPRACPRPPRQEAT